MFRPVMALALSLVLLLGACGDDEPGDASGSSSKTASASPDLVMVVLGDSDATGAGDSTGEGWAGRYANLVRKKTGAAIDSRTHATEGQTTAELLSELRTDGSLQDDIAAADFVVIGAGGGDLNLGDEAFLSGECEPRDCYEAILKDYGTNIEAITSEIVKLTGGRPVVLRAITLPYVVPGAEDVIPAELLGAAKKYGPLQTTSLRDSTCQAMRSHGGDCIDILTAFNGADGQQNAYESGLLNHDDCCYASSKGQQLMAELLLKLGIRPRVLR